MARDIAWSTWRRGGAPYDLADLGCAALGIALAVTSVRLFSNTGALVVLGASALGGWALASILRRMGVRGWVADAIHLAAGAALLVYLVAPAQRWGILPTPAALEHLVEVVRRDFTRFDSDVAPLVARSGHLSVMAALGWTLALFNSSTAMRLRAPVQAVVPHLVAFVGLGFVARDTGRVIASAAMLVSVGLYALTQATWRNSEQPWLPERAPVLRHGLRVGSSMLLIAGVVTAIVAPLLPGGPDPTVDLRRGGLGEAGPRTVVSPFVEVGSNLGARSDELLFTVEGSSAQYWRLSALDTYDADKGIWVLSNSYEVVDSPLDPEATPGDPARFEMRGLGGIWVPAPEHPVTAEADFGLNWDPVARSVIRRDGELRPGDTVGYTTPAQLDPWLAAASGPEMLREAIASPGAAELRDARGAPNELLATAQRFASEDSAYDALIGLQNHFRQSFTYDEQIDLSASADPLADFMVARRGFCQQFSTAFALGARAMGYAARVVVGFTAGDPIEATSDTSVSFAVRGRHAHAWPEVLFEGIGWVPFEPTPGRGNPASSAITGVAAAQAPRPPGEEQPADLGPTTTAAAPELTQPTAPPGSDGAERLEGAGASVREPESSSSRNLQALVVLTVVALVVAMVAGSGRLRAHRHRVHSDPLAAAWIRAVALLGDHGYHLRAFETPLEFAARCDDALGLPDLVALATAESRRRWAQPDPPGTPSDTDETRTTAPQEMLEAIRTALGERATGPLDRTDEVAVTARQ